MGVRGMKTVKFKVNKRIFLDLIGLNDFNGNFYISDDTLENFEVTAYGEDERLPDSEDYPECKLTLTRVREEARFVKVE